MNRFVLILLTTFTLSHAYAADKSTHGREDETSSKVEPEVVGDAKAKMTFTLPRLEIDQGSNWACVQFGKQSKNSARSPKQKTGDSECCFELKVKAHPTLKIAAQEISIPSDILNKEEVPANPGSIFETVRCYKMVAKAEGDLESRPLSYAELEKVMGRKK